MLLNNIPDTKEKEIDSPNLLSKINNLSIKKENLLDISKNIKLFNSIHNLFTNLSVRCDKNTNDIEKLTESYKAHSVEENTPACIISNSNIYEIQQELNNKGFNAEIKFDLITLDNNFHMFDQYKLLQHIKNNLLNLDGVLFISGKFDIDLVYHTGNEELNSLNISLSQIFKEYIKKVLKYFPVKTESLHDIYSDINYKKHFKTVKKEQWVENITLTLDELITYLKKWAAYQLYIIDHQSEEFTDPILDLEQAIKKDNETNNFNLTLKRQYFCYELSNN